MDAFDSNPAIAELAKGKIEGGELMFSQPSARTAIDVCTEQEIAVLGVELFTQKGEGVYCTHYSVYQLSMLGEDWLSFAKANNRSALAFIADNPAEDSQFYLLTAASFEEFKALSRRV